MRFWDSSAIVPLLISEETSSSRLKLQEIDPSIVTWWSTHVECESALSRIERRDGAALEAVWDSRDRLTEYSRSWRVIMPSAAICRRAFGLLRSHPLRAADALQLAAALHVNATGQILDGFVCNDRRLAAAAQREGMRVD